MTFPGSNASIIRNDAGEVIGWDYPDEGDGTAWAPDPADDDDTWNDDEDDADA